MGHGTKVGLYTFGALRWLADNGLIDGNLADRITTKGVGWFDQLEAEGFRPAREDVKGFLGAVWRRFGLQPTEREEDSLVTLIANMDRCKEMISNKDKT